MSECGVKILEDLFSQAADVPDMSLDEINAEIKEARNKLNKDKTHIKRVDNRH